MINELKTHKIAYPVLLVFLLICVVLFLHLWPDRNKQKLVALAMGVFYFFWGVIIHKKHNHINSKVFLEYLTISVLASSLLILLLN